MLSSARGVKQDRAGLESMKLDIGQFEGVSQLSVVVHTCDPSISEAETGGSKFKDCLAIQ